MMANLNIPADVMAVVYETGKLIEQLPEAERARALLLLILDLGPGLVSDEALLALARAGYRR